MGSELSVEDKWGSRSLPDPTPLDEVLRGDGQHRWKQKRDFLQGTLVALRELPPVLVTRLHRGCWLGGNTAVHKASNMFTQQILAKYQLCTRQRGHRREHNS